MRLVFGKGDILVTHCKDSESEYILFEHGSGTGVLGEPTHNPDRNEGAEISQEAIDNCTVSFQFDNPTSCAVVLEKMLLCMLNFREAGQCIQVDTKEQRKLARSVHVMMEDLSNI